GMIERGLSGLSRQTGSGAADATLSDPAALPDPLVTCVEDRGEVVVGHDLVRKRSTPTGDARGSHVSIMPCGARRWVGVTSRARRGARAHLRCGRRMGSGPPRR